VIGKSAASWQQVGNGTAEAAGDEKGASGGQKRAFRTLFFASMSVPFRLVFTLFLLFPCLFQPFCCPERRTEGRQG